MIFRQPVRNELQERLDQTRELEDVIPDQAGEDDEQPPFRMTGLYELIPGTEMSPMRIDSWVATRKS